MPGSPIRFEQDPSLLWAALALSLASGRALELSEELREGHPTLLRVAEALRGNGRVLPGSYLLDLGTPDSQAAQTSLERVLGMVTLPLALAGGASSLRLRGVVTHPGFPYWVSVWCPWMRELGFELSLELKAAGFGPEGGGELLLEVRPARAAQPFERCARGNLRETQVWCSVSNLEFAEAGRASGRVLQVLREHGIYAEAKNIPVPASSSRGLDCLVSALFERSRVGFDSAEGLIRFVGGRAAVDGRLASLLLLPLALGAAGMRGKERPIALFTVSEVGEELLGLATLAHQFLDVEVAILAGSHDAPAEVRIAPTGRGLVEAIRSHLEVTLA